MLYLEVSGDKRRCLKNGYKFKLIVDRQKELVVLYIYDSNWKLIDTKTSWSFEMLKEKLERKLSYLAYVEAEKKRVNQKNYFKYDLPVLYRLKSFEIFLSLIEKGVIIMKFAVGIYKKEYRFGETYDHGTMFCIEPENLPMLFDKMSL